MNRKSNHYASNAGSRGGSGNTTDVIEWMRDNAPRSLDDVELLRKGMRKNVMVSMLFERQIDESESGRKLWHIKGHASTLILASEKHIKFFRKKLQERRKRLQIDQEVRESIESSRFASFAPVRVATQRQSSGSAPNVALRCVMQSAGNQMDQTSVVFTSVRRG